MLFQIEDRQEISGVSKILINKYWYIEIGIEVLQRRIAYYERLFF